MPELRRSTLLLTLAGLLVAGCTQRRSDQNFVASFYDMSEDRFSVQAIAPPPVVREYAVCKAVWFAEKKNAQALSLSNPIYDGKLVGLSPASVPNGWSVLQTTAYLSANNPDGNPSVSVAEFAAGCRQTWDWYR